MTRAEKTKGLQRTFVFLHVFLLPFRQHLLLAVDADEQQNEGPIHGIVFFRVA